MRMNSGPDRPAGGALSESEGAHRPDSSESFDGPVDTTRKGRRKSRVRSLGNLMAMGHCAPVVMKTILDMMKSEQEWPVRLAAGLPGGIGNTGFECGGITSPLVLLGLRYGPAASGQGPPLVFSKGHDHCRRFMARNGTLLCREIRGEKQRLWPCIMAIRSAPELYAETVSGDPRDAISRESQEAYRCLLSHLTERGFHCSHDVLHRLGHLIPVGRDLLDGTYGFLGGTLMMGLTCSALTAGIMAVGLRNAEIEWSRPRVLRMIALMLTKGDAFADKINTFNIIMNEGDRMSQWFAAEFGSTQCRAVTQSDFSTVAGVNRYIESDYLTKCRTIAEKVAEKVRESVVRCQI